MLRTLTYTLLLTTAPMIVVLPMHDAPLDTLMLGTTLLLSIVSACLIRTLRRRAQQRTQRHTVDMLARGGKTIDLILSEADRRAAQRDSPPAM